MLNGWLKRLLPGVVLLTLCGGQAIGGDQPVVKTGGVETRDVVVDSTFMDALKNTMKIRKSHLVRPDLIPYPVDASRYC